MHGSTRGFLDIGLLGCDAATSASCLRWLTFLGTDAQTAGEEAEGPQEALSSLSSPSR